MSNQRKGNLTEERVQQLNALGFEWDQKGSKWNARYRELVEYKAKHNRCHVPQRHGRNLKKRNTLSAERIEKFDSIGLQWAKQVQFKKMKETPRIYERLHGSAKPPSDDVDVGSVAEMITLVA